MITLLTTGVFDLFHHGHVDYLKSIVKRYRHSYLRVGIGTDACIRRLKGDSRPFYTAEQRESMLDSCEYVDEVIIFDIFEDGTDEQKGMKTLIESIMPDVFVTGPRHPNQHAEQYLKPLGIPFEIVDCDSTFTTTQLIKEIKENPFDPLPPRTGYNF